MYGTLVAVYGTFDIEYFKDLARTSGSVRDVCGSVRDVLSLKNLSVQIRVRGQG